MLSRIVTGLLVVLAAGFNADRSWAQTPAALPAVAGLRIGQKVWLTLADGTEESGRIEKLSPTSIDLKRNHSAIPVPVGSVGRIDVADSILDGIGKGMKIGAFAAIPVVLQAGKRCGNENCGSAILAYGALGAGLGIGVGAAVGALLDSSHAERTTIYHAKSRSVTIAPVASRRIVGVSGTIRW